MCVCSSFIFMSFVVYGCVCVCVGVFVLVFLM